MGRLYIIENVPRQYQDVTLRTMRVLKEVSVIVTQGIKPGHELLEQYQVYTPVLELVNQDTILEALNNGDVAWITGSSSLAPSMIRSLLAHGVDIVPLAGSTAEMAALVASGLPSDRFTFFGLLPPSSQERCVLLRSMAQERHTLLCNVFAEHLQATLDDLQTTLGDRRIAIYQGDTIWRGRVSQSPVVSKGQVTLVIDEAGPAAPWTEDQVREQVRALLATGASPRDAARKVSAHAGWPRRKVYAIATSENVRPG